MYENIFLLGKDAAKAVADLESLAFSTVWSADMYRSILNDKTIALALIARPKIDYPLPNLPVFGIIEEGRLLAYIASRLFLTAGLGEVYNIAVQPDLRRRGLGSSLLRAVLEYFDLREVVEINLELQESNHAAMALYSQNAFACSGLRKGYYSDGENAVLMSRFKKKG